MKNIRLFATCLVASASLTATAATFNFEGTVVGSGLTTLSQTDSGLTATFTRVGGLAFEIRDIGSSVPSFGSRTLAAFNDTSAGAFIVDFSTLISGISVSMGDFAPSDADTLTLTAFTGVGGTGSVLGTVTLNLLELGGGFDFLTLNVGAPLIQSITMNGGSVAFPNSVFYDNLVATTATATRDAGSAAGLLLAALAATALLRRQLT